MNQDRIIAKMKKLLAMAEGTANENEAMSAARQLHAMLAKHNISMEDLSSEENPVNKDGIETANRPWKRIVASKIAELYFCSFYFQDSYKSGKAHYMFVGTEANRTFAIYIFKMIVKVVEKGARVESKKRYGKEDCGFVNSFWTGAKTRITERCNELIGAAKAGTLEDEEGNTLPALLSTYEQTKITLDAWCSDNLSLSKVSNRTRATNAAGYNKGQEAGNRVQLSRTLHGNQSPKLLGAG